VTSEGGVFLRFDMEPTSFRRAPTPDQGHRTPPSQTPGMSTLRVSCGSRRLLWVSKAAGNTTVRRPPGGIGT